MTEKLLKKKKKNSDMAQIFKNDNFQSMFILKNSEKVIKNLSPQT